MTEERPDPDQLLSRIQAEEARSARGRLKVFFGASAGVGKTYAMLAAARQQLLQGADVVVGVLETHGRMETEVMADGLEHLPRKEVPYRGRILKEFDLDGALARKPGLILVDELAHSNAHGSRHPKRWQDVDELLAAGIDVYTTVNVQHLETLNDVVSGITGIRVWETVPDKVFDAADEVILVDLPPDELLQRLKDGKVYLPHQAERAIRNFFRKGNLIALRELALRRTADRVDGQMLAYRREQFVAPVWQTRDSFLGYVSSGDGAERIVRSTARMAARLEAPWHIVYVETPGHEHVPEQQQRILNALKLAQELGGQTATLSGSRTDELVIRYARDHNLSKLVLGRDPRRFWWPWHRSFADRVGSLAPELDVLQIASVVHDDSSGSQGPELGRLTGAPWRHYAMGAGFCVLAAVFASLLHPVFDLANIVMVFLMAVVTVAVLYGRGPAVLASVLSVPLFDFCFVEPRFSFAVSDVQYLLTFVVMLMVALLIGQLTAGFKYQAEVATYRERRVRALYEISKDLSGALLTEQIAEIGERFLTSEFGAKSGLMLVGGDGRLLPPMPCANPLTDVDFGVASWAFEHEEAAGQGTDTLPGSPALYVPLRAPMRVRGILAVHLPDVSRLLVPEQRRVLETASSLMAIAIERVHYVDVAQDTTVKMESERLRNSLLSAISHDIRTPLSVLIGLADSLLLTSPPPSGEQVEVVKSIHETTQRISAQVANMLDMARLQAGRVQLNRQWLPLEEIVVAGLKGLEGSLSQHALRLDIPVDLPLVEADAVMMERVVANLVENAIKYTPPGTEIVIGARQHQEEIQFWVTDHGPGVPQGKEEMIFKKFERGSKESTITGVGLGLAICRAIVGAHGGSMRAGNLPEGGACFTVSLPAGHPPAFEDEGEIEE